MRARVAGCVAPLLGLLGACGVELPARPVDNAARVLVDCGTIAPNLAVACNDGSPPQVVQSVLVDERAVQDEDEAQLSLPCELVADPGRRVLARYHAACLRPPDVIAQLVLDAHVERRCGRGAQGSAAEARPRWRLSLRAPPDASAKLRVLTETTATLAGTCRVVLGDAEVPVPPRGPTAILSATLAPNEARALVVDCSGEPGRTGLAVTGCFGAIEDSVVSAASLDERLIVTLVAAP